MKIVINCDYGGFGLSRKALHALRAMGNTHALKETDIGEKYPSSDYVRERVLTDTDSDSFLYSIPRNDPDLIKIVEDLGSECNARFASLKIVEIPDDVDWEIEEYDGNEWVSEKHRRWS